jgi:alkylated DNA nucleotide flippase Atl1
MQVRKTTFAELVSTPKTQFRVPLYQRPYSWEKKNWKALWEAVTEQANIIADDHNAGPEHFLGSLVLAPGVAAAGGTTVWIVVDGQQRLTTLSILLCALRDSMTGEDPEVSAEIERTYLLNSKLSSERWKLLPTQLDRQGYQACLDGRPGSGNIGEAYRFFQRAIMAYDDPDDPHDLARLEQAISQRMELVCITSDRDDNVHRIFESLNNTGMTLGQSDLLRNYLFMLLPTRGEEVYARYWEPMERLLDRDEKGNELVESLSWLDLVIDGQVRVRKDSTYEPHQRALDQLSHSGGEAAVVEVAVRWHRRAGYLRRLWHPEEEPNPAIRRGLQRFIDWDTEAADAAMMVLLDRRAAGSVSNDDMIQVMDLVESFLVRRWLCAVPSHSISRILAVLATEIADGPVVEKTRSYLSRDRQRWPEDDQVRDAIRANSFYLSGRFNQRCYVLRRLEESLGRREPIDWESADLSIEHVMPQTLSAGWQADLADWCPDGESVDDVVAELEHNLGNLTLTAYNGQLSNRRFADKRVLLRDSGLSMNHEIAAETQWGPREIRRRAEQLADRAVALWPAPLPQQHTRSLTQLKWKTLHQALAAIPAGSWTTYGDLAELIGSHAVPVGAHLANNVAPNPWRVLASDGSVSSQFRWHEPGRTDDPLELLQAEGVKIDDAGRADPAARMTAVELAGELDIDLGEQQDDRSKTRRDSFERLLDSNQNADVATAVRELIAFWDRNEESWLGFGGGKETSCFLFTAGPEARIWPFALYPVSGRSEVVFQHLKSRPPFDNPALREEFRQKCNTIGDVEIPEVKIDLRPSFNMEELADSTSLDATKSVLDWFRHALSQ